MRFQTHLSELKTQVDVWTAYLDLLPARWLAATLSAAEIDRAARLRHPDLRTTFVAGRGLLRQILSSYTGIPAFEIEFGYSEHGKPFFRQHGDVAFNVSHSGRLFTCSVTLGADIGIDIERMRSIHNVYEVVRHNLSPEEAQGLQNLAPELRMSGFFSCWTRKEAFIKATGEGFARDLRSFTVSVDPNKPARLLSLKGNQSEVPMWKLLSLRPDRGYMGAIALRGPDRAMCFRSLKTVRLPAGSSQCLNRAFLPTDKTVVVTSCPIAPAHLDP